MCRGWVLGKNLLRNSGNELEQAAQGEVLESLSLEIFKQRVDVALKDMG